MKHPLQHRWITTLVAAIVLVFLCGCPTEGPGPENDINPGADIVQADCVGDSCEDSPCPGGCAIGVCHPELKVCVACLDDTDCGGSQCHPVTNACVQCYEDAQCPGGKCTEELICVQCTSDLDCGKKGTCNLGTNTCEGECSNDKTCNDGNVCTEDTCDEGACVYAHVADGTTCEDGDKCTLEDTCLQGSCLPGEDNPQCCEDVICSAFQKGKDTNGDGCIDYCYCPDEKLPAECPKGSIGVDNDGDGCFESCECNDPSCISCEDDDDCNDAADPCSTGTCVVGACEISTKEKCCVTGCDCYKLAKVSITCDSKEDVPYWECQSNTCLQTCGELPEEIQQCICKPLECAEGQSPTDTDNDGCDDTCVCGKLTCDKGLNPTDTDNDGCDDACLCEKIKCKDGLEGVDTTGNGCPDTCACPGGAVPGDQGCIKCKESCDCYEVKLKSAIPCLADKDDLYWSCEKNQCTATCGPTPAEVKECLPCTVEILCTPGTLAVDTDKDGCVDSCMCPDGNKPDEVTGCDCVQADQCLPSTKAVDSDLDGCTDWCQCGSGALVKPGDSCPCLTAVSCGPDEKPVDTDEDGCDDACACDSVGCDCVVTEDCKSENDCFEMTCHLGHCAATNVCCEPIEDCPKGATEKDTTGDGCPDTCECDGGIKPGAESCNCMMEISCLAGFTAIDTNDDGCEDTCAEPCQNACDCYGDKKPQDQSCGDLTPSPNQGVSWTCSKGFCQEICGPYTPEHYKCMGCKDPVTSCPDGATPIDTTGDKCPDSCPAESECEEACDCYAEAVPDAAVCLGADAPLCADCKSAWTCNQGTCESACLPEKDIELCLDSNVVCIENADCPTEDHFCLKVSTGACKELGQCSLMPDNCKNAVKDPVCGCDNQTYDSSCEAYMAGTSVKANKGCK